jgi:glycerol-3-phosphate dehydrogenase
MSRSGPMERRDAALENCRRTVFDAAIIGGGVNGAAIFDELSRRNYRVVLLDKGDFACGTSQASAMMIWGSLPDIGRLRFIRVGQLCRARERLLTAKSSWVVPKTFRYLPSADSGRGYFSAITALYSYWLLGRARRARPVRRTDFPELSFLRRENFRYSLEYEEACVAPSDARFVLDLILANNDPENPALNYCGLQGGSYSRTDGTWNLEIADAILGRETEIRTRTVINAAGSWTDGINRQFSIETPYKHVLSKGVFMAVNRDPRHDVPLMIETRRPEGSLA